MNKKTIAIILSIFILNKGNVCGLGDDCNLKQKNILTSKALLVPLALGGALACGYFVHKKITNNNSDNLNYEKYSYESKSLLNKIEIDERFSDIDISVGDISNTVIDYYQNDRMKYEISEENGILKIRKLVKSRISFFDNTNDPPVPGPLKIIVPKNKIDFDISGGFGNMSLKNLESSNIKVDCSHGNIRLKSIIADKIDLNSSFGDINFENLNAKNIKIEGSYGDVSGSLVGSEKDYSISFSTKFGNCNLKNSSSGTKSLSVNSSFGDIDISFDKKPTVVS